MEREADIIQHSTELPILHYKENTQTKNNKISKCCGKTNYNLIQLKPVKRKAGEWYLEYNPFEMFTTKNDAINYDKMLKTTRLKKIKPRVPTLYTYTHIKPGNIILSVSQGSHTIAHRLGWDALIKATTYKDICDIFDEQILEPKNMEDALNKELPPNRRSPQMKLRLDRWLLDYQKYYSKFINEAKKAAPDLISLKEYLNYLLNMDVYATYGWKTTKPASKKSLKGKGESIANHDKRDKKIIDVVPARGGIYEIKQTKESK